MIISMDTCHPFGRGVMVTSLKGGVSKNVLLTQDVFSNQIPFPNFKLINIVVMCHLIYQYNPRQQNSKRDKSDCFLAIAFVVNFVGLLKRVFQKLFNFLVYLRDLYWRQNEIFFGCLIAEKLRERVRECR